MFILRLVTTYPHHLRSIPCVVWCFSMRSMVRSKEYLIPRHAMLLRRGSLVWCFSMRSMVRSNPSLVSPPFHAKQGGGNMAPPHACKWRGLVSSTFVSLVMLWARTFVSLVMVRARTFSVKSKRQRPGT